MSHLTFVLFGLNPTLSARVRRSHEASVNADPAQSAAVIGKALRQGRYDLMARICGEAGYLPNHLLDMAAPHLAIETRTGLAWKTGPGGGHAVGTLFDLLKLPDLAAIAETWQGERDVHAPVTRGYAQWLVDAADVCLAERAWIQGTTLHMQATRYELIDILVQLLRRVGRAAREGEFVPVSDVFDTLTATTVEEYA